MSSWTLAASLTQLRREVNAAHPGRGTASDGTIGDTTHSSRTSDHNPDARGVVRAWDCSSSPSPSGDVAELLAEFLRTGRDRRVKYVIWRGRMFSSYAASGVPAWTWRPYDGINGHFTHVHVSVQPYPTGDDDSPWGYPTGSNLLEDLMAPNPTDKKELADAIADAIYSRVAGGTTVLNWAKRIGENSIRGGVRAVLHGRIEAAASRGDVAEVKRALAELEASVFGRPSAPEGAAIGIPLSGPDPTP